MAAINNYDLSENEAFLKEVETKMFLTCSHIRGENPANNDTGGLTQIQLDNIANKRDNKVEFALFNYERARKILAKLITADGSFNDWVQGEEDNDQNKRIENAISAHWNNFTSIKYNENH